MGRTNFEALLARSLSRRDLLLGGGAFAALALASQALGVESSPRFPSDPFTLGVASGDPTPDGVVLWTRLAIDPLNGGGMPAANYTVEWRVADDAKMSRVVKQGTALAAPTLAHSVHVEVSGLQPGRVYWYQFTVGPHRSPVGRTKTAPAPGAKTDRLRFAFASCQDYQNGFFAAYAAMAKEDLDFVVHLGDYIYEYGPNPGGPRQHNAPETKTLADYRNRYALYKRDRSLQAAHAAFPFVVVWDDHEVRNDYAGLGKAGQAADLLDRRAAAYQAYYEHMPLRRAQMPKGPDLLLYRRFAFGDLAELSILDTRQYRTDQPCKAEPSLLPGVPIKPRCAEALSATQTMTGPAQEKWLLEGLERSRARWNVIGQQTMFAEFDFLPGPGNTAAGLPPEAFNLDQWDGYPAARSRLLQFLNLRKPSNPVVITGDIHSSWVHDLKMDFADPKSATVGAEFVGTSITSSFPRALIPGVKAALADNPHCKFFDGANRGYVLCTLTRDTWRSDFRVVPTSGPTGGVLVEDAPATTLASFVVENGKPGAHAA